MSSARLKIVVQPGAKRNEVKVLEDHRVRVVVSAKAIDGQANEAVLNLLAEVLRVKRNAISLVRGATSRTKTVEIQGLTLDEVWARLRGSE